MEIYKVLLSFMEIHVTNKLQGVYSIMHTHSWHTNGLSSSTTSVAAK